ncbi:hypothetical protein D3C72_2087130 [compost metagenome]
MIADLPNELDQRVVKLRTNHVIEVVLVRWIDFCSDLQRNARPLGNFNCSIRPFLRRYAAQKG